MPMRIGVLTTGRQDWGILRSTCLALRADPAFELLLLAGGMHTSRRFGFTLDAVRAEGFTIDATLPFLRDDVGQTVAEECGEVMRELEIALSRLRPDALLLVGDRYETLAAAVTATLARVPIIHLHGGEETQGALDDTFRHAITKLAHLHLVSHPQHAARVSAMGEAATAIHVVGAPGLDNARRTDLPSRAELEQALDLPLRKPVVLVTLHPATLGDDPAREAAAVTEAMDRVDATYVITLPNSDPGNAVTRAAMTASGARPGRRSVDALGERLFWGMLREGDAILGNSSSALIEAPLFRLPAVNVGMRQHGRLRGDNVIDADADPDAVSAALQRALDPSFRARIEGSGPFGDGHSAARIVEILKTWVPPRPPRKPSIPVMEGLS